MERRPIESMRIRLPAARNARKVSVRARNSRKRMSYNSDFQMEFISRSLDLLENYSGPSDATNLMNCLFGLVIVPNGRCFDRKIKISCPVEEISLWGIPSDQIGTQTKRYDIANYIRKLRNSISHARFSPDTSAGVVTGFLFFNKDKSYLTAMSLGQLRTFAARLTDHLKSL